MVHYYSRESKTHGGEFTIMQVNPPNSKSKESLVCRTPRGDMAAHLVTTLNQHPIPIKVTPVAPTKWETNQVWNDESYGPLLIICNGNTTRGYQILRGGEGSGHTLRYVRYFDGYSTPTPLVKDYMLKNYLGTYNPDHKTGYTPVK